MAGRPYGKLGVALDAIARERNVRGPYRVAAFIRERTGGGPRGSHWSQVFYGEKYPSPQVMKRFVQAFELSESEVERLASVYLYEADMGVPPNEDGPGGGSSRGPGLS